MATDHINWDEVRNAYIGQPNTSYRKLAKEYGISYNAIWRKARDEHWVELKSQSAIEAATLAAASIAAERAEGATGVVASARKLLVEFDKTVAELGKAGAIKPKGLKDLADSLLSIQKVMDSQPTELDIAEQQARIDKMRKDSSVEDVNREIVVQLKGVLDEYV